MKPKRSRDGTSKRPRPATMAAASLLAAAILTSSYGTLAASAHAEVGASTPTVQAVAARATWLAYAPRPATLGVVCLVDSGVDMNRDTEAVVVGSHEIYPETGPGDEIARLSPRVDGHPDGHGTLMAMLVAAPENGWGMVGLAPRTDRVYSMKALANGSMQFHDSMEADAITTCARLQKAEYPTMLTINLSLGGESTPEPVVASEVEDAIAAAKRQGIAVLVAAGNTGGPLSFPASYAGAISVGAADAGASAGTLCAFSAHGAEILAPGCDTETGGLEGAWQDTGEPNVSEGTSQADAIDSSILEAMETYNPMLTESQVEGCMSSTTDNGEVNAAAAFRACGLGAIVQQGAEAEPKPSVPAPSASGATGQTGQSTDAASIKTSCGDSRCDTSGHGTGAVRLESFERSCARPVAKARRVGRYVRVAARHAPAGCVLQARIRTAHVRKWTIIRRRATRTLQFASPAAMTIQVRFIGVDGLIAPSAWTPLRAT
jgi:hypothetical protein